MSKKRKNGKTPKADKAPDPRQRQRELATASVACAFVRSLENTSDAARRLVRLVLPALDDVPEGYPPAVAVTALEYGRAAGYAGDHAFEMLVEACGDLHACKVKHGWWRLDADERALDRDRLRVDLAWTAEVRTDQRERRADIVFTDLVRKSIGGILARYDVLDMQPSANRPVAGLLDMMVFDRVHEQASDADDTDTDTDA